jgi:MFS family permease
VNSAVNSDAAALAVAGGVSIRAQAYVLFAAALILLITNGLTFGAMTAYDSSILDELGITVAELKLRETFLYAVSAMLAPFAGYLVDRFGTKPLLLFGAAILAACFASYSGIDSLGDIYRNIGVTLVRSVARPRARLHGCRIEYWQRIIAAVKYSAARRIRVA